ncbi:MAG: hypothetical protein ABSA11_16805 [Candidatus Bathyarchaeia archaeon]|jgi:hypothetical protein
MVDLGEIQVAYYMIAATGVLLAAAFYVINIRAQNRNREAQLFMNIFKDLTSNEFMRNTHELMYMEWSDYDDFERKYGSDNNVENYVKRMTTFYWYNGLGLLLEDKLIDESMVYGALGSSVTIYWEKFKDVLLRGRGLYGPELWLGFEFLADRMAEVRLKKGQVSPPKSALRYVPDKLPASSP